MVAPREPSMEDILASIKRVIAEEKEIRAAAPPPLAEAPDDDVLELDSTMAAEPEAPAPPSLAELAPPLMAQDAAETSRAQLAELATLAAAAPPPSAVNPLEDMVRDLLRPVLKDWLDQHLPRIVDEHVRREIGRITGRKL
jgi:cell pole-organizing protein PopZ